MGKYICSRCSWDRQIDRRGFGEPHHDDMFFRVEDPSQSGRFQTTYWTTKQVPGSRPGSEYRYPVNLAKVGCHVCGRRDQQLRLDLDGVPSDHPRYPHICADCGLAWEGETPVTEGCAHYNFFPDNFIAVPGRDWEA